MLPHHRRLRDGGRLDAPRVDGRADAPRVDGRIDAPRVDGRIDAPVGLGWAAWAILAVVLILVLVACQIGQAHAEVRYIAQGADVMIVLHDEPCAFTEAVSNLPLRATWQEQGQGGAKPIEGCWSINGAGIVMLWFEDRTVAGLPRGAFAKLGST